MKNIILLIRKDLIRFLADKPAVLLTFLVPAVLILIFGSIFGGGEGSRGKIPIIVVNTSHNEAAEMLVAELDSSETLRSVKNFTDENGKVIEINEEKAIDLIKNGSYPAALILPENFMSDTSISLNLKYYYDPRNEIESQLIQGTIQKTIFTKIPSLFPELLKRQADQYLGLDSANSFRSDMAKTIAGYFGADTSEILESMTNFDISKILSNEDSTGESSGGEFLSSLINFETKQLVGNEVKNPGVTRIVGGWAIMFLLFTLTGASISIFEEKQEGSLKRIFCMPITRSQFLWAKYIYSILLGIVQLSVLFLFAYFLYDVDIFSNFGNLMLVVIASSASAVAFAMIITAFSKSMAQANGISTLFILIMSALGGSWFPVSLFPGWMQALSKYTLTYWSVEAFLQVLWRDAGFAELLFPYLAILIGIAIIANYAALYLFKKRQVI